MPRLCIRRCGIRKRIISHLVVNAWVPRIGLGLVGWSTIAMYLLSLSARFCPRVRRLRLWVSCALLLFVDY